MGGEEGKMRVAYRKGQIDDMMKPENKTARWRELNKRFEELIAEQRQIMVKDEFDRIYSTAGGSRLNSFTAQDLTAYFFQFPANQLQLLMWMGSAPIPHSGLPQFF